MDSLASDWESFNKNYGDILYKFDKKPEKVINKDKDIVRKVEIPKLEYHISTMTVMYNIDSDINPKDIDKYCLENIKDLHTDKVKLLSVDVHESTPSKNRQTGFYFFTTYKLESLGKIIPVKIFNHGMFHMTGIQSEVQGDFACDFLMDIVSKVIGKEVRMVSKNIAMINCNYKIGFKIKRQTLMEILKRDYNVHCMFDACNYPGVLVKVLWNKNKNGICGCEKACKISDKSSKRVCPCVTVAIFGTGSFNITGAKSMEQVSEIADWIIGLLVREREFIEN